MFCIVLWIQVLWACVYLSLEPRWCRLQLHSKAVSKETVIEAAWGSLTFGDSAQFNFLLFYHILPHFIIFCGFFGVLSSSTPIDTTFSLRSSPESPRRPAWLPRSRRWICDVPWDWPFRSLKIASRMFLGPKKGRIIVHHWAKIVHHGSQPWTQHHNPFTTLESKRHQVNYAVPRQFLWRSFGFGRGFPGLQSKVPLHVLQATLASTWNCTQTDTHLLLKIWVYYPLVI